MAKFRLELNIPGFIEARKSSGVQGDLMARAERIAAAAGGSPDFEVINSPGATRARVVVVTATGKGKRAEAVDRSLSRALQAGG